MTRWRGLADFDLAECACGARHREVDIYPVGVFADIRHAWRFLTARKFPAVGDRPPWSWRVSRAQASLQHARQMVVRQVRQRKWHELKNTFNGYLAEPYHWPDEMNRCGAGWTKGLAMRSLVRRGWRSS